MINLSKAKKEINVVCDQIGSPTYARDLALVLAKMIKTNRYGIYHTTNEGYCSWAEFAQEIFKLLGIATKVNFIPSSEYPTAAKRPLNSRLSKRSLSENGFEFLPHWKDALKRYLI
jgi:dTDP-4-dehydrorhamnose reductase